MPSYEGDGDIEQEGAVVVLNQVETGKVASREAAELLDLALHYKSSPAIVKDIARRQKISERYLENLLTLLRRVVMEGLKLGYQGS